MLTTLAQTLQNKLAIFTLVIAAMPILLGATTTTCVLADEFACLSDTWRPLVKTFPATTYRTSQRTVTDKLYTKIDARKLTVKGYYKSSGDKNSYPFRSKGVGACTAGGTVIGEYPYNMVWDWTYDHDANNAGFLFEGESALNSSGKRRALYSGGILDGARIHNVWDGIRPEQHDHWLIRHAWVTHNRDDCVENDYLFNGYIYDSLFDGCFSGISANPGDDRIDAGYDGRGKVVRLEKVLLRLAAFPGPPDNPNPSVLGHGGFFKWDSKVGPDLVLIDNIFMVSRTQANGSLSIPKRADGSLALRECRNNVVVWMGSGNYPGTLPSHCFRVVRDRNVWENAVRDWKLRHPRIRRIAGVDS